MRYCTVKSQNGPFYAYHGLFRLRGPFGAGPRMRLKVRASVMSERLGFVPQNFADASAIHVSFEIQWKKR